MINILMISAELGTPDLLKLKVFWNENYDLKTSVYDVSNKVLTCESNYIVDVVFMKSYYNFNFIRFDLKNICFWGVVLVYVQ